MMYEDTAKSGLLTIKAVPSSFLLGCKWMRNEFSLHPLAASVLLLAMWLWVKTNGTTLE